MIKEETSVKRILSALVLIAVLAGSAYALSDKDYTRMKRESSVFREADRKLGAVWHRIEDEITKPARSVFEILKSEQRDWIKSGRDRVAKKYMNDGFDDYNAYAIATYERIGYLEGWEAVMFSDDD